eukprot:Protomagalhaensia_sp_Gyna_25__4965@NODE_53_length_6056_cov_78_686222_g40_i0_p8_GENE_NODE_53_length_6056_cov_78_686222_g40_i0NODE_53_length_6056_cov_78_686222_g40_i0_p8_ORF_typecomplete_len132_score21_16DUF3189/PF11385_8/0_18_NODE_53_length_6056_cov_78_686222_g40_i014001795
MHVIEAPAPAVQTTGNPNATGNYDAASPGIPGGTSGMSPGGAGGNADGGSDAGSEIQDGNIYAGYKSSLNTLLTAQAHLNKLRRMKEGAGDRHQEAQEHLAVFEKYVKAVKSRDRRFPEWLTCMGCRRTAD